MNHPGTVLLVDDEESVGRLVRRHLAGWNLVQAYHLAGASAMAGAIGDLHLVLLDLNLGDTRYLEPLVDNPFQGSFVLARELRQAHPAVPVVIFSGHVNATIVNAAHLVGAEILSKEDCAQNLQRLRQRLDLVARAGDSRAAPFLAWLRAHRGMTAREGQVAALAVQGVTRYADIAAELGISPNTVKRHVTSLLDRAGVDTLLHLALFARDFTA